MLKKLGFIGVALLGVSLLAHADDPPAKPWKDSGEVSVVSANGNSRTETTSIKNLFTYTWTKTALEIAGGGLGSSSGQQVTSEQYNASEKMKYTLVGDNYVFERFGWDKDRFAGVRDRYDSSTGLGRVLMNLPKDKLNTELGAGYVNEVQTAGPNDDYPSGASTPSTSTP